MTSGTNLGGQALELDQLFPQLERLLEPPVERSVSAEGKGRPSVRGLYAGRRTTLRLEALIVDYTDDGTSAFDVEMEGRTYGLVCTLNPPAALNRSGAPTGDPEFDARYDVTGAPCAVLSQIFGPEVRAHLKQHPCWLRFEADRLSLGLGSKARSVESVATQLAFAASLLARLPDAIRAAGDGRYLELGSLGTHPELVALANRHAERRKRFLLIGAILLGVMALGTLVLVLVVWLLAVR